MNYKELTIYLPTYNRCNLLEQNLSILVPQVEKYKEFCRLIISDNCSTDQTEEIVKKYLISDNIYYERNSENIGATRNHLKSYSLPNTKYLWILGDDDFLKEDSIKTICDKISGKDYSVIFMNYSYQLKNNTEKKYLSLQEDVETTNKDFFYSHVGCDLTFISPVIINTSYFIDKQFLDFDYNLHFIQTYIASECLKNGSQHLIISDSLLIAGKNYSANYSMYSVFGKELFDVTQFQIKKMGFNKRIVRKTYIKYIKKVVLPGIVGAKINKNKVMLRRFRDFFYATKRYLSSWFYIYPVIITPRFILAIAKKIKNRKEEKE